MTDKLERGYASVENEEYRKGYREGWRDAMNERLPEHRPMKPTPYVPGTPWVQPLTPGWPIDTMPSYYRCPMCGLLKSSQTSDCMRKDCPQIEPKQVTITYTTDNTSGN